MNPVEAWLTEMRDIRRTGAGDPETSYYGPLEHLFNEIGKALKPKVRCVISLSNSGAGKPDGGFFTREQFAKASDAEPQPGQLPERGAIEVKSPADELAKIIRTEQVNRYVGRYGLLLVTNYRDFVLLGHDAHGRPLPMEGCTLADSERAFWSAAEHPRKTADEYGERLGEYLKRVMLAIAPLADPRDVAWFLGSYARDAKVRVEQHKDLSALAAVRTALEEALGMKFTGERGEHFFRSTLVQTIFYGVFSAWVLWHRADPDRTDAFNWRETPWFLHVPFIRALYEEVATPSKLGPLGLVDVLDWTAAALSRVNRAAFFGKFQDEHAVQYFYEPFLEAFDPELRKELGVWYTPPEIVQYQVARVDTVLREELNLPDGLADPNVVVLDPCCGTGAYLVEVLRHIGRTLRDKGGEALVASDLKTAAMTRVFGFEILPAPFVVSHLQLGLMLQRLGAPLNVKEDERVGVYLTNALTGWQVRGEDKHIRWTELEQERKSSGTVKREKRILVILGNPPYNAFAGVSPEEEHGLVEPYKGAYEVSKGGKGHRKSKKIRYDRDGHAIPERQTVTRYTLNDPVSMGGWGIKKFNLDDLYVRFFRLAERRIAEMTGRGVVSFISNHSWIAEPSFVVLRKHLLESFDKFWIENLHGNRKISEYAPDGRTSQTIFAIRGFSPGIQQGVATSLWVKTGKKHRGTKVVLRDDLNASKASVRRQHLLDTLTESARQFISAYMPAKPSKENRYSFRPEDVSAEYSSWASVAELSAVPPFNGPVERRANSLIVMPADSKRLARIADYLDPKESDEAIRRLEPAFMNSSGEFDAEQARRQLKGKVRYDPAKVCRYPCKPFDTRVAYLDADIAPLFSRPSPKLLLQRFPGNAFLITRDTADKAPEGPPFLFSPLVCDYDCISGHARHFPVRLINGTRLGKRDHATLFDALGGEPEHDEPVANLSKIAREYLKTLKFKDRDVDTANADLVWMHVLAVGYSPAYLAENADGIRRDWPRIPLPDSRKALEASAELGRQVAALLHTETGAPGGTAGTVEPFIRTVGVLSKVGGGGFDVDAGELAVTAGWGHAGKGGATMPGKGRIVARPYDKAEREAIAEAAKARGLSVEQALDLLGPDTRDVYLNERAYWKNVPANVWDYTIGGYQVIKKWLSYREHSVLGRALTSDEVREVTSIARRLAALVLLQPALDANYRRAATGAYIWSAPEASTA